MSQCVTDTGIGRGARSPPSTSPIPSRSTATSCSRARDSARSSGSGCSPTGRGPLGVTYDHAMRAYAPPRASVGLPCVWGVERDHRATPTERGSLWDGLVVLFWWSSDCLRTVVGGGLRTPPPTTTPTTSRCHHRPPRPPLACPACLGQPQGVCWAGVGRVGPGWAVGGDGVSSSTPYVQYEGLS